MKHLAVVTGGGTGIGLACVEKFLAAGWNVLAHYNASSQSLKRLSKKYGKNLACVQADFSVEQGISSFTEAVNGITVDALVNNAGIYDFSRNDQDRMGLIHKTLMVNTVAPVLIAEAVFEQMKRRKKGAIVNISTIAAKYGSGYSEIFYGVSKRGLEALTRTLSREGAEAGICVNTIRPGAVDTDFHKNIGRSDQQLEERRRRIPMNRLGRPQEIADMVFHLCAQNNFATNQTITIAGGD